MRPLHSAFQFLIGTLQTTDVYVSLEDRAKFQFLIGTLQTIGWLCSCSSCYMFQFLIGTLQTLLSQPSLIFRGLFQFLIGTLQTNNVIWFILGPQIVSIPYRYATNQFWISTYFLALYPPKACCYGFLMESSMSVKCY